MIFNYPTTFGQPVWAMGWGTTSSGGGASFSLQNVRMTLYEPFRCANVVSYTPKNWNNQLCAGEWDGGKVEFYLIFKKCQKSLIKQNPID
jgi:hypothetical protein